MYLYDNIDTRKNVQKYKIGIINFETFIVDDLKIFKLKTMKLVV